MPGGLRGTFDEGTFRGPLGGVEREPVLHGVSFLDRCLLSPSGPKKTVEAGTDLLSILQLSKAASNFKHVFSQGQDA